MEFEPADRQPSILTELPAGWPQRTRRLVGQMRTMTRKWLAEPLKLCLNDFDRTLQQRAVGTRDHVERQRLMATREHLAFGRQRFQERFVDSIDRALVRMGVAPQPVAAPPARFTLSLLDPVEHELTTTLDQLVARSEARCGPLLVELSYRFAVLLAMPPLETEELPLGPQAMAQAFREATEALGLPVEHHLLLLQSLEGRLIDGLVPLYELVNSFLAVDGILPQLRPFPLPRGPRPATRPSTAEAAEAPRPAPEGGAGAARPAGPAPTAAPDTPPDVADVADPGTPAGDDLRGLLAQRRAHRAVLAEADAASAEQLQAALAALQAGLPAFGDVHALLGDAGRLRRALVDQLNAERPLDAPRSLLGPAQDDTLELIVRLFQAVHAELAPTDLLHDLLDLLQLPALRAALADPAFFTSSTQPARRLLDRLLAATRDWLEGTGGDADRGLRSQIERLADEFARHPTDGARAARLLEELEHQLAQQQRKAQLAERRHVESVQGRERLEQARERARELVEERFARHPPTGLVRTLLERAWSDVLALTLLRNGEQSEAFAMRLVVTDQLLGRLPLGNRDKLQAEVEAGLQQIGIQGEEATQVARRLTGGSGEADDGSTLTGLAMRLRQHQRFGEGAGASLSHRTPLSAAELRLHQRLSQRRTGWFEFVQPEGGTARRRLAWYSTRSGRSLFVTRQGQRAEELSLAELTGRIARGQIRELPALRIKLLERAWRNVAAGLAGKGEAR